MGSAGIRLPHPWPHGDFTDEPENYSFRLHLTSTETKVDQQHAVIRGLSELVVSPSGVCGGVSWDAVSSCEQNTGPFFSVVSNLRGP